MLDPSEEQVKYHGYSQEEKNVCLTTNPENIGYNDYVGKKWLWQ